ncbi:MAG: sigma-54-dependent Fis family transcriptional regulator [Candidatus Aminicenantes bacterium]|nr:sigma-54-dependent Fis family transcriptional regulator [Candidatus Aminicenantes bacterium]
MSKGSLHVIDDEPVIRDILEQLLSGEGYDVELSASGEEALPKFETAPYDLVLLDLLMPGRNGLEILPEIKRAAPQTVVIIITAYASVESAIEAMKIGAYDYVQKPFKHEDLLLTIERALAHKTLQEENDRLREELRRKFSFSNILGRSKPMERVFDLIRAAAPTRSTILVQGESGTGKELVARAIHTNSPRAGHPFIIVNSGALPPDLLESHLFGHVKGAFTGAVSEKQGLFEAADKGTIFFDEISTIGLETQAKLLRVMQEREFMRLGGTKTIRVDVRIIAATNVELEEMIQRQTFRKDLYYRLNVIKIVLPPLRERPEDIPLLVKHFLDVFSRENEKQVETVSPEVFQILDRHPWPGNVRELENLMERTVVFAKSTVITPADLPELFTVTPGAESAPLETGIESGADGLDFKEQTLAFQRRLIETALAKANGVQKNAAALLGLKPTTLNEMIKRLDIPAGGF